ncbi:N-terminal EF-hand calcium-binding protein 3 isoform X2 [Tachyglossus aculeatus]|uniref:N-terminal EF-hand calcium-binding protein 3 isoform X2 n=1 Tax=Tachyglossus aculeatus TaxID=9261 RepID=UPI0018F5F2AB|nr:N-terminal EF-hand calcium-binding protein 3 isoform X2 [Tachyglossus aculeatus]
MSCAQLLTMCLLSAKPPARLSSPPPPSPPPPPPPAGLTLFQDIFRRADKDDDGKLSFDEFQNYFADGILSSEELRELFSGVLQQSPDLETEKFCDYFSQHLGEFRSVLSALEALNVAVLTAMDATKLEYEWAPKVNQFMTRFLLRETASQLQSLHLSLECASDCVESQAGRGRADVGTPAAPSSPRPGRRSESRAQKTVRPGPTAPSSKTSLAGASVDGGCQWTSQILRLQRLIDQLEWKSRRLELPKGEALCKETNLLILVVQRRISVAPAGLKQFHQALRCYTDITAAQSRCLQVSTQRLADESSFLLYEFWQDASSWSSHSRTNCSKAFQRILIDLLRTPEILTTMLFPASWWIMNN